MAMPRPGKRRTQSREAGNSKTSVTYGVHGPFGGVDDHSPLKATLTGKRRAVPKKAFDPGDRTKPLRSKRQSTGTPAGMTTDLIAMEKKYQGILELLRQKNGTGHVTNAEADEIAARLSRGDLWLQKRGGVEKLR